MDRLVIHVVIKQDYQAGCIVTTKPKIEFKFAWYEMRTHKHFIILLTSNLNPLYSYRMSSATYKISVACSLISFPSFMK